MDAIVELENVSVAYAGSPDLAVRDVSLSVEPGQFVCLVGPSGSGKTSLLKTINRLAEPAAGNVRIEGRDIGQYPPHELRRRIGYAFQNIGLFPHMSVRDNIGVTLSLLGWPRRKIDARVEKLVDLVALPRPYLDRAPAALSGGEKQRVGVARALAAEPKIVIMDEPFGALDPVTREALGESYRDLHRQFGVTTLMVTHDLQEAALLADRIVVLRKGEIVADGAPRVLLRSGQADAMFAAALRQARGMNALLDGRPA